MLHRSDVTSTLRMLPPHRNTHFFSLDPPIIDLTAMTHLRLEPSCRPDDDDLSKNLIIKMSHKCTTDLCPSSVRLFAFDPSCSDPDFQILPAAYCTRFKEICEGPCSSRRGLIIGKVQLSTLKPSPPALAQHVSAMASKAVVPHGTR